MLTPARRDAVRASVASARHYIPTEDGRPQLSCDLPLRPRSRYLLRYGAIEPFLEMRRCEARFIAGSKALIVQLCAEVVRVRVRNHFPGVSRCTQVTPGEFIHT